MSWDKNTIKNLYLGHHWERIITCSQHLCFLWLKIIVKEMILEIHTKIQKGAYVFLFSCSVQCVGDFLRSNHLVWTYQDCSLTKETKDSGRQECLASLKNRIKSEEKKNQICLLSLLQEAKCFSHLLCLIINWEKNKDSLLRLTSSFWQTQ